MQQFWIIITKSASTSYLHIYSVDCWQLMFAKQKEIWKSEGVLMCILEHMNHDMQNHLSIKDSADLSMEAKFSLEWFDVCIFPINFNYKASQLVYVRFEHVDQFAGNPIPSLDFNGKFSVILSQILGSCFFSMYIHVFNKYKFTWNDLMYISPLTFNHEAVQWVYIFLNVWIIILKISFPSIDFDCSPIISIQVLGSLFLFSKHINYVAKYMSVYFFVYAIIYFPTT